jgi:hypothetical protein
MAGISFFPAHRDDSTDNVLVLAFGVLMVTLKLDHGPFEP